MENMKNTSKYLILTTLVFTMSGCSILNNLFPKKSSEDSSSNYSSSMNSSDSSSSTPFTPTSDNFNPEDSSAQAKTIKQMLDANGKSNNTTTLYRITAVAQWPKNTNYGNFDLVDSSGYVYVYGCSKNKSSISKSGNNYTFTNDKSFSSMNIKPGDEITMEGLYLWYTYPGKSYGYAEFQGYVTSVKRNGLSNIQGKNYTASETYSGSYYNSVSGQTGSTLLTSLHNLMDSTHSTYVSYSSLDSHFHSSDKYGSNVKCFYSGKSTSSYNKEHVWPQSLSGSSSTQLYGEDHGGSDIHHIRPTISDYNSKRGNSMFGPVYGSKSAIGSISYSGGGNDYYTGNVFEPADAIKGDVARIIMYMYMHYSSEIGGASASYYGEMHINWVMGTSPSDSWKLLREWNADDPVSEDEKTRNEYAFSVQGNRNPFIDHPSYADAIWG